MSRIIIIVSFVLCNILALNSYAQKDEILVIKDGQMHLRINTSISQHKLDSILKTINMMNISVDSLRNKNLNKSYTLNGWEITKSGKDYVELSKKMDRSSDQFNFNDPFIIEQSSSKNFENSTYYPQANFGYNTFKNKFSVKPSTQRGKIRFVYYGKLKANNVYLSGSFNVWATEEIKMIKTDTAWICDVSLLPGKHLYKFIVDGEWVNDPENKQKEDDTYGGYNSVYFVCNYDFELKNYSSAKKVILTGSFNAWNERELSMVKVNDSWKFSVYLQDGTYSYKFIVDKTWITDPSCTNNLDDGYGNINSILSIGVPTVFVLNAFTFAKDVYLAGDFNNWRGNDIKLTRENKMWRCAYVLAPGNYLYKYVVDGDWLFDPASPIKVVQPNYTFKLKGFEDAKDVRISGSFLNWKDPGIPMVRVDSNWVFSFHLEPGKHTYKYIIDGKWILDPTNPLFEQNEFDTGNSFIWFDPKNKN